MDRKQIHSEIDRLLVSHFSRDFWLHMADEMQAAYGLAHDVCVRQLKLHAPELIRALPQNRHYKLNSVVKDVAPRLGLEVLDLKARNKGENYVVVRSGTLQVGRIGVNQGARLPRTAKHRALISALNARLEGYTHDLFSPNVEMLPANTLGLLLLNINPKKSLPQDRMLDLQVGVPFSDLSGWHYIKSCGAILAMYADTSVSQSAPAQDGAIVTLKKSLTQIEEESEKRES